MATIRVRCSSCGREWEYVSFHDVKDERREEPGCAYCDPAIRKRLMEEAGY